MRTLLSFLAVLTLNFVVGCNSVGMSETKRPVLTIDDMLKVEGVGSAVIDPSGRWLVYEKLRPYDEITDFSFRTYAFAKTGHQLWRYDLEKGGEAEPLPGVDPEPHRYAISYSPAGEYLALMQYRLGELFVEAYDMKEERVLTFPFTPAFSRSGEHNPVWVSETELAFSALPAGRLPEASSARAYVGRKLPGLWNAAWRGLTVTAEEYRTSAHDYSDEQEEGSLVVADARTGGTTKLASGLFADLRAAPNQTHLAALAVSKPKPIDLNGLVEHDTRRYRLVIFDLRTREPILPTPDLEFFPYTITWSADGNKVAAFGWPVGKTPRDGRFYVVDVNTGGVTRYDHNGLDLVSERERGWQQRPERAVFVGDKLAIYARPITATKSQKPAFSYRDIGEQGLKRPDWYFLSADGTSKNATSDLPSVSGVIVGADFESLTVINDTGLFRVRDGSAPMRITPDLPGTFSYMPPGTFATRKYAIRPEFEDQALVTVKAAESTTIVLVDLRRNHAGQAFVIAPSGSDATPLAGSLKAKTIFYSAHFGPSSRALLHEVTSSEPKTLHNLNDHLSSIQFGEWRSIDYDVKDPDAATPPTTVRSCVLLPPTFDPSHPPPLIVEVYPGVGPSCRDNPLPKFEYPNPYSEHLWSGRGFAYARLSTPRELIRTKEGPIAGIDEMISAGVDALADSNLIDPDRVALFGKSQGGIAALYTAAHNQRFKAVISMNSWADMFSHYFSGAGIYSYGYGAHFEVGAMRYDPVEGNDFGIGRTPFEDPEVYYTNSPVFLAPQIDAPVLLVHSDMDSSSMLQFDEMYSALMRSGKEARYVRYFGEGHGPSSPANIRDMWRRIDSFLNEALFNTETVD